MEIFYRLKKYALAGGYAAGHWSAETCGYSTLATLVEKFNAREEWDRTLTFKEDGRTPEGVYKDRFTGAIYALQLEMKQLEPPEHGNTYRVLQTKQWTPSPICPWGSDDAWHKPVPPYRMEALNTFIEECLPDKNKMERDYVAAVIRRSIERDTLARNKKSIQRFLSETSIYMALAIAMTG